MWISNGSGATISIGIIQSKGMTPTFYQFLGSTSFLVGILCLLLVKVLHEILNSLDRKRFNEICNKFLDDEVTIDEVISIRNEPTLKYLRWIVVFLRFFPYVTFITGLSLYLYSFKPF